MDFQKSINLFEIKEVGHMIIFWTIILFTNLLMSFQHHYYA